MRLAVYTDFPYHRGQDGSLWAEQAFGLFIGEMAPALERLVVIGRLDADPASARHRLPGSVELLALPHYGSLISFGGVLAAFARSLAVFWRGLAGVDAVWLMGPHPFSLCFAALALARGRTVALGVRQDLPAYMKERYRDRPAIRLAALALEATYRMLAKVCRTVVVGPVLSERYRKARGPLQIAVSLVRAEDISDPTVALSRDYREELCVLSAGRLDPEKNPLLGAEVLAELAAAEPSRWRLTVCGEGPLAGALRQRLEELGVQDLAELRGYLPYERGMKDLYRGAHFLLLTSWTEGLPQVALEAFAAGLPIVATEVGGLGRAAPGASAGFPPGDAEAGARCLRFLAGDPEQRGRLVETGLRWVGEHTAEIEAQRVVAFLREGRL
jgi:glycosyltransferase involved in cell wall biosynthesis